MKLRSILRVLPALPIALAACSSSSFDDGTYFGQPVADFDDADLRETRLEIMEGTVEVQGLDLQRQLLRISTEDQDLVDIYFDQNTIVMYQDQQRPIVWLEPGDVVRMELLRTGAALHAGRVDVHRTVQERGSRAINTQGMLLVSGRIAEINHESGIMHVETPAGIVIMNLNAYPTQATLARFRRLQVGNEVNVDALPAGTGYAQIFRFR